MVRNSLVLKVSNLTFGYRINDLVCRGLNVEVSANEIVGIMGPSGCGKSTLLRLISGFLRQQDGHIEVGEKDITAWSPKLRPTSMVFQNSALFPFLSVYENLAFGLRAKGIRSAQISEKVDGLLDMLELRDLSGVDARNLSGGQKQRVAIGRSLAVEPNVLLLDEPLSSIDERLRDDLRLFIRQILKNKQISAILVSHAFQDTASICDKVAFWQSKGLTAPRIVEDWIESPEKVSIAEMIGYKNIVPVEWLNLVEANNRLPGPPGKRSSHIVIPEDSIKVASRIEGQIQGRSGLMVEGIVKSQRWRGTRRYIVVNVSGTNLETEARTPLNEGSRVIVLLDPTRFMWVDQ